MIRPYEVVYIFDSALEDEAIAQKLTTVHAMIQVEGAEPPVLNIWGRRTLAYPIKRHTTGYYVVANFNTDATLLPEFERALKLDDAVLRFLVVLNDTPPTPAQVIPAKGDDDEEE
ncbi:MAG: 30S ribosomal protein S6 [Gemmatimonadota bacterium]|jgi:small subunit ribosomal protein S6|nr:30S ribosomal protein S6 [Gemmatimonadota bacterium]